MFTDFKVDEARKCHHLFPLLKCPTKTMCDMTFVKHKNRQLSSKHKACLHRMTDIKRHQHRQAIFRSWQNSKQEMMKYFNKTVPGFFDRWDRSYSVSLACVHFFFLRSHLSECRLVCVCVKHLSSKWQIKRSVLYERHITSLGNILFKQSFWCDSKLEKTCTDSVWILIKRCCWCQLEYQRCAMHATVSCFGSFSDKQSTAALRDKHEASWGLVLQYMQYNISKSNLVTCFEE